MKERVYKMLNGYELIVSEEALFVRVAEGRMAITTSEEVEFDRVLALVDHMQQQLTEKDEENKQLMSIAEDWQRQYVRSEGVIREKDATIERMKENMHTCPDCGFEFHHYGEKSCPECENDRKDATIEELKDESDRINNHLFNACKDVEALRKALDDIKPYIQSLQVDILNESPSYLHNAINLILHKIDTALGEGDKWEVTVTLHNRGYEKHELDFGEGDKE